MHETPERVRQTDVSFFAAIGTLLCIAIPPPEVQLKRRVTAAHCTSRTHGRIT